MILLHAISIAFCCLWTHFLLGDRKCDICILQTRTQPPHFKVIDSDDTLDTPPVIEITILPIVLDTYNTKYSLTEFTDFLMWFNMHFYL